MLVLDLVDADLVQTVLEPFGQALDAGRAGAGTAKGAGWPRRLRYPRLRAAGEALLLAASEGRHLRAKGFDTIMEGGRLVHPGIQRRGPDLVTLRGEVVPETFPSLPHLRPEGVGFLAEFRQILLRFRQGLFDLDRRYGPHDVFNFIQRPGQPRDLAGDLVDREAEVPVLALQLVDQPLGLGDLGVGPLVVRLDCFQAPEFRQVGGPLAVGHGQNPFLLLRELGGVGGKAVDGQARHRRCREDGREGVGQEHGTEGLEGADQARHAGGEFAHDDQPAAHDGQPLADGEGEFAVLDDQVPVFFDPGGRFLQPVTGALRQVPHRRHERRPQERHAVFDLCP